MANENLEIIADGSNALAAIAKIADQNRALEATLLKVGKAAEKAGDASLKALNMQNAGTKALMNQYDQMKKKYEDLASAQSSMGSVAKALWTEIGVNIGGKLYGELQKVIDLQKEYNKEISKTAIAQDDVARKVMVQSLMNDKEYQLLLKTKIQNIVQDAGVDVLEGQRVSMEMQSLGFSKEEATGKSLYQVLKGGVAQDQGDKVEYAQNIASYLDSQGLEKTAENVNQITSGISALKETSLKGSDLGALAPVASVLKEFGMTIKEQVAAFTVLKDSGAKPEQAATALKNIATILGTVASKKESADTIKQIGGEELLKSLAGKPMLEQMSLVTTALEKLTPQAQKEGVAALAGRETVAPTMKLLSSQSKIQEHIKTQDDKSVLDAQYKTRTSGIAATQRRIENNKLFSTLDAGKEATEAEQKIELLKAAMAEDGASAWMQQRVVDHARTKATLGLDPLGTAEDEEGLKGMALRAGESWNRSAYLGARTASAKQIHRAKSKYEQFQGSGTVFSAPFEKIDEDAKGKEVDKVAMKSGNLNPNFADVYKTPLEREKEALLLKKKIEDNKLEEMKDSAKMLSKAPGAEGRDISASEQKPIQAQEDVVHEMERKIHALERQISEIAIKKQEEQYGGNMETLLEKQLEEQKLTNKRLLELDKKTKENKRNTEAGIE